MANRLRFLALFVAGLALLGAGLLASPSAPVYAQSCDTSGTVDGTAEPGFVQANTVVTFTATGFNANEEVSFWFTTPQGDVLGTAQPLCCATDGGRVEFAPTTLPPVFFQFPGKWALTVQGAASSHQSIIYFCLGVQQAATATPVAPTATAVPATATTAPVAPTSTTAPVEPSATAAVATSTTAPVAPTAEASATTAPVAPTAAVPTAAAPTEAAPTAALPTAAAPTVAVPAATATMEMPTAEPSPSVIGMPITGGGSGTMLFVVVALAAFSLMALGLVARRSASGNR